MKILMMSPYLVASGGAERAALQDVELLRRHGHDVVLMAFEHPEGLPQTYPIPSNGLTDKNYVSRQGLATKGKLLLQLFHNSEVVTQLARALEAEQPDLIHLHRVKAFSPAVFPLLRRSGIPVVMTLHDHYLTCPSSTRTFGSGIPCNLDACRPGVALQQRCVSGSTLNTAVALAEFGYRRIVLRDLEVVSRYIVPSHFLRDWSIRAGIPAEKLIYLPNATAVPPAGDRRPSHITYVGRLSPEKGLETLLQAAALLPKIPFRLVGDGPLMTDIQRRVERQGLANVELTGALKGAALTEAFETSHALVLPSTCFENAPLVILEAFAHGTPVIGSRRGGIPELITEGETGFTFEPGNAADLASRIEVLLSDPAKASRMGQAGRAQVLAGFSSEGRYDKLMAVYRSVRGEQDG